MASLPSVKKIGREDLAGAPDWVGRLLGPLNQFMESVWAALKGDLTFRENIRSSIRKLRITTLAAYASGDFTEIEFPTNLGVKADGVLLLQITEVALNFAPILNAVTLCWTEQEGSIHIKYIAGLEPSKRYDLTLLVI